MLRRGLAAVALLGALGFSAWLSFDTRDRVRETRREVAALSSDIEALSSDLDNVSG